VIVHVGPQFGDGACRVHGGLDWSHTARNAPPAIGVRQLAARGGHDENAVVVGHAEV